MVWADPTNIFVLATTAITAGYGVIGYVDDYLKLANPLWSARELRGRVLEVRRETVDSATLATRYEVGGGLMAVGISPSMT